MIRKWLVFLWLEPTYIFQFDKPRNGDLNSQQSEPVMIPPGFSWIYQPPKHGLLEMAGKSPLYR